MALVIAIAYTQTHVVTLVYVDQDSRTRTRMELVENDEQKPDCSSYDILSLESCQLTIRIRMYQENHSRKFRHIGYNDP